MKADELWDKYAYRSDSPPHITYTQFLAALAEYGQAEWQPIETAPRDGTIFMAINMRGGNGFKHQFVFSDSLPEGKTWASDAGWRNPGRDWPVYFTHWMPLPDAPAAIFREPLP